MAKYRKIDPAIWNDKKFRSFSNEGKIVFMFLLTHPYMTSLGAMRCSIPGLAAELGWKEKAFEEAFSEAFSKGMVKLDREACFLWLPNFIKYNKPESPNVVKAWAGSIPMLPECNLLCELLHGLKDYAKDFGEGYQKAFEDLLPKAIVKTMPNQEQEQEQEHREGIKTEECVFECDHQQADDSGGFKNKKTMTYSDDFNEFWNCYPRKIQKKTAYAAWNDTKRRGALLDLEEMKHRLYCWDCEWRSSGTDVQYIPHCSTWLNDERFNDMTICDTKKEYDGNDLDLLPGAFEYLISKRVDDDE